MSTLLKTGTKNALGKAVPLQSDIDNILKVTDAGRYVPRRDDKTPERLGLARKALKQKYVAKELVLVGGDGNIAISSDEWEGADVTVDNTDHDYGDQASCKVMVQGTTRAYFNTTSNVDISDYTALSIWVNISPNDLSNLTDFHLELQNAGKDSQGRYRRYRINLLEEVAALGGRGEIVISKDDFVNYNDPDERYMRYVILQGTAVEGATGYINFANMRFVKSKPSRAKVLLRIDDGVQSVYTKAMPILREYATPANVMVTPKFIQDAVVTFDQIGSPTGNPQAKGYYEQIGDSVPYRFTLSEDMSPFWKLTEDTSVVSGKNYYKRSFSERAIHNAFNANLGAMTLSELKELHELGWSIGSHTWGHNIYNDMYGNRPNGYLRTYGQAYHDLASVQDWLIDNGFADTAYGHVFSDHFYDRDTLRAALDVFLLDMSVEYPSGSTVVETNCLPWGESIKHVSDTVAVYPTAYAALEIDEMYQSIPKPNGNPSENGYYERSESGGSVTYTLSGDTAVMSGKTYYRQKSPKQQSWYEQSGTAKVFSTDSTIIDGKTYYKPSAYATFDEFCERGGLMVIMMHRFDGDDIYGSISNSTLANFIKYVYDKGNVDFVTIKDLAEASPVALA